MPQPTSAGLLMFSREPQLEMLLAHPGGPFFAAKDDGAWSIPKGLVEKEEDYLSAAMREFAEETGYTLPAAAEYLELGDVQLKSGKVVLAWAFEGTWEAGRIPESNTFSLEWPPKSGILRDYPEIDRAEMFPLPLARQKINARQVPFLERLADRLGSG